MAGSALVHMIRFRNDTLDLLKDSIPDKDKYELVRKVYFQVWELHVQRIMRSFQQLGAVRACSHCGGSGEDRNMRGDSTVCEVCRGTSWEPLI